MTLTSDDRAQFLVLLPHLAPGADAGPALAFFRDHEAACRDELGAVPGHDQARTGLLRLMPALDLSEGDRGALIAAAEAALGAYEPETRDPMGGLRRHPAWVGLATLELAARAGEDPEEALATAIERAGRGYAKSAPGEASGVGEVIWALAEAAAEVGWDDHAEPLLERAARATFSDPENLGRVRLVQIMRLLATEEASAAPAVDALLEGDVALDDQTRTHALWIGAHLDRAAERLPRALARLEEARSLVDVDEEPEIAARLDEALQALGATAVEPGEA